MNVEHFGDETPTSDHAIPAAPHSIYGLRIPVLYSPQHSTAKKEETVYITVIY